MRRSGSRFLIDDGMWNGAGERKVDYSFTGSAARKAALGCEKVVDTRAEFMLATVQQMLRNAIRYQSDASITPKIEYMVEYPEAEEELVARLKGMGFKVARPFKTLVVVSPPSK